jgi:chemotaxis protein MotB
MAKKGLQDDGDAGGEDWLVSYADMMTLVACFFILMMAFANYEEVGFSVKIEEFSKHFRKEKFKSSKQNLKFIHDEMAVHELKDRTKISLKDSELIIKFSSSIVFPNGKAQLTPKMKTTLDSLIEIVKITNSSYRILIEGHADDDLSESTTYDSQWTISSARAASIAKRFEFFGFPKDKIVPIGRGDSQPLFAHKPEVSRITDDKAKLNRRVVIRLLEPEKKKFVKFGLGVYFKDATEETKESTNKEELEEFEVE